MAQQESLEAALSHVWRYFEVHSQQRIAVFNYFLLLSGGVTAGLAATLQGSARLSALGIGLGLLLVLVSFVFWKLDQRSSFLIKRAEQALSRIEGALPSDAQRLFLTEPEHFTQCRARVGFWRRHWTYGQAFRFVFVAMGLFGVVGSTLSALKFGGIINL